MAKIDILLPFWGDVGLFEQAVLSVIAQTESDWNLTILDDHYPSSAPKAFVDNLNDSRIRYIRHDKNIGITKNFNLCIESARADHCMIIGCDDLLTPNYVELALSRIGDADMYQPKVDIINRDSNKYLPLVDIVKRLLRPRKSKHYSGEKLATSLSRGNWLYFPSIMWRTSTLQRYKFDPKFKIAQDVILELQVIIDGGGLYLDNQTATFLYRRFPDSLSSKEKRVGGVRFQEEADAYTHIAGLFRKRGWVKAARVADRRIISRIHKIISQF